MPKSNFDLVRRFHEVFGVVNMTLPTLPTKELAQLRIALIEEELQELKDAIEVKDIVEIADALTDLLVVTYGAGHVMGIDLDACFKEVHNSNMSKLGEDGNPIYRVDGKVLKGPNFVEPDLQAVLAGQGYVKDCQV